MKHILVLGGKGYLGRHLVNHLTKDPQNNVLALDRDTINLKNLAQCKRLFKNVHCDEIYQLAADSGSIDYLMSKEYSYGDSTQINLSIIKALKDIDFRGKILFPSSFYAINPHNYYGLEKLYNEALYLRSGLDVRIPRLFSVYGSGEKLNSPQEKVATAFCRRVIEKKNKDTIKIVGHPKRSKYFLHINDAIRGLIAHMQSDMIKCDLAGNDAISLEKLMRIIIDISGKDIRVFWDNNWKQSEGWIVYYPDKCSLEWQPMIGFGYGIDRLYRWVENELR